MEEKTYKPKLRITTLEDNGSYIQDRLVDAYTEMNSGPKIKRKRRPKKKKINLISY